MEMILIGFVCLFMMGGGGGDLIRCFYHRFNTEQETICTKLPFNISFSTERLTLEICMYKTAFMPHIPIQKNKLNQYEYVVSSVRKRNTKKITQTRKNFFQREKRNFVPPSNVLFITLTPIKYQTILLFKEY